MHSTALTKSRTINSAFHHDSFPAALPAFPKRMPDYQSLEAVDRVAVKSSLTPQGVGGFASRGSGKPVPPCVPRGFAC